MDDDELEQMSWNDVLQEWHEALQDVIEELTDGDGSPAGAEYISFRFRAETEEDAKRYKALGLKIKKADDDDQLTAGDNSG